MVGIEFKWLYSNKSPAILHRKIALIKLFLQHKMKKNTTILLQKIKQAVKTVEPDADIILYGSYARGQQRDDSDIDLLILVNEENLSYGYRKKVTYPLYKIELDTLIHISPFLYNKKKWEMYQVTPFYQTVKEEGIFL